MCRSISINSINWGCNKIDKEGGSCQSAAAVPAVACRTARVRRRYEQMGNGEPAAAPSISLISRVEVVRGEAAAVEQ